MNGLSGIVADTRCSAWKIVAGHDIAVHWVQQPPPAAASLRELQLIAAARCAHLHGGAPADWWVAGDWDGRRSFVCAALPREVVRELSDQASTARLDLEWTTAWLAGSSARAAAFQATGWNVLQTSAGATLWHARAGRIDCIVALGSGPEFSQAQLQEQVERQIVLECARDGTLGTGRVHWESCFSTGQAAEAAAILALSGGVP